MGNDVSLECLAGPVCLQTGWARVLRQFLPDIWAGNSGDITFIIMTLGWYFRLLQGEPQQHLQHLRLLGVFSQAVFFRLPCSAHAPDFPALHPKCPTWSNDVFQTSEEYIALNIGSFDNQNIANSAWAYATTQLPSNSG